MDKNNFVALKLKRKTVGSGKFGSHSRRASFFVQCAARLPLLLRFVLAMHQFPQPRQAVALLSAGLSSSSASPPFLVPPTAVQIPRRLRFLRARIAVDGITLLGGGSSMKLRILRAIGSKLISRLSHHKVWLFCKEKITKIYTNLNEIY